MIVVSNNKIRYTIYIYYAVRRRKKKTYCMDMCSIDDTKRKKNNEEHKGFCTKKKEKGIVLACVYFFFIHRHIYMYIHCSSGVYVIVKIRGCCKLLNTMGLFYVDKKKLAEKKKEDPFA